MPNDYHYCPDGVTLENYMVNQILLNLTGKLDHGIPMRLRGSNGQDLLLVDDSGVKMSRDGIEAPTSPFPVVGMIIAWHGSSDAIPDGWLICDGANGTPDLRDRFIIGAGSTYALDATGGSAEVDLSHDHDTDIDHDHAGFKTTANDVANLSAGDRDLISVTPAPATNISGGDHRHFVDVPALGTTPVTSSPGGSTTQSVLNPYYGLFFIKRTAA